MLMKNFPARSLARFTYTKQEMAATIPIKSKLFGVTLSVFYITVKSLLFSTVEILSFSRLEKDNLRLHMWYSCLPFDKIF